MLAQGKLCYRKHTLVLCDVCARAESPQVPTHNTVHTQTTHTHTHTHTETQSQNVTPRRPRDR